MLEKTESEITMKEKDEVMLKFRFGLKFPQKIRTLKIY